MIERDVCDLDAANEQRKKAQSCSQTLGCKRRLLAITEDDVCEADTAGRRAITADTDLRLCRFFGLSKGYWLRAQAAYDSEVAEEALAETLDKIKPWVSNAA